jgi:hypothetical protein
MPDQKVTELTPTTAPLSTDLFYLAKDPSGVPLSRSVEGRYVFGSGGAAGNLIKNSPGQIVTDGAEPQWWDSSGSATFTDEDAVGEGIPDISERIYKLVTVADDHYGYQTFTLADEERLDAGVTVVSLSAWVYCATGAKASIAIYGANLGLQESAQAGAGAWELLTVENITLNAADATFEVRFYGDTITAFIAYPVLNVGSKAIAWVARQEKFVPIARVTHYDLNTTGDVAWSDTDCTANTDPLATAIQVYIYVSEPDGTVASSHQIAHSDDLYAGAENDIVAAVVTVLGIFAVSSNARIGCNDSQVIRYQVSEQDADSDVRAQLWIGGYWMWD